MKPVQAGRAKILLLVSLTLSANPVQSKETSSTPFVLPPYQSQSFNFKNAIPPIKTAPPINSEDIFNAVIACYPSPSRFDISLKLQAGASAFDESTATNDLTDRGKYYVGIVAEMPLLDNSATLERERQREYERRTATADQIAKFIAALSKRNQAERELGLYTGLEQRAQIRVKMGVTGVSEQVGYMEKVIASQQKITAASAEAESTRLALQGFCQDDKKPYLANYLR